MMFGCLCSLAAHNQSHCVFGCVSLHSIPILITLSPPHVVASGGKENEVETEEGIYFKNYNEGRVGREGMGGLFWLRMGR